MLTDTLRRAERDGLIVRHLDDGRIETATLFELTDLGRSLDVPLVAMTEWADANWHTVEAARRHWGRLRRETLDQTFNPPRSLAEIGARPVAAPGSRAH